MIAHGKLLALVYGDLFDYPLTGREIELWTVNGKILFRRIEPANQRISEQSAGHFFLKGRQKLLKLRQEREITSERKLALAKIVTVSLKRIPTISGIFITGSIAAGNAQKEADIDLLIVTKLGSLWLTRLVVVVILKLKRIYRHSLEFRDKVCTNIFLDTNNLEIKSKNLYTAHEILQAKCLFDRGGIEKRWLEDNRWTKEYLPYAYKERMLSVEVDPRVDLKKEGGHMGPPLRFVFLPLELLAFVLQYLYMRNKITNEKISLHSAFFHPNDLSEKVLVAFEKRLKALGIIN